MTDALVARLKSEFGVDEKIIRLYAQPYVYLNHDMVKQKKIDLAKLQDVIAEEVTKVSGVAYAVTSEDIKNGRVQHSELMN